MKNKESKQPIKPMDFVDDLEVPKAKTGEVVVGRLEGGKIVEYFTTDIATFNTYFNNENFIIKKK